MMPEVRRLVEAHKILREGSKGPDPHNAVLKSAVVFLCATWEIYCESVALEAATKISEAKIDPQELPEAMQWQIKVLVHDADVQKSKPLSLAGDGWRKVVVEVAEKFCDALNTPKSKPIDELFQKSIGLKKLSGSWTHCRSEIDSFGAVRGDIAHMGADAPKVSKEEILHYLSIISKSITDTDNAVYDHLKHANLLGKAPWQKTN